MVDALLSVYERSYSGWKTLSLKDSMLLPDQLRVYTDVTWVIKLISCFNTHYFLDYFSKTVW